MSSLFGTVREGKHQQDNLLSLPNHEHNEHVKALINQLITWKPDTKGPTDLVMALWFCEIRAQELVRQGMYQQTHMSSKWATRKNRYSQTVVNLDDFGSENYIQYL